MARRCPRRPHDGRADVGRVRMTGLLDSTTVRAGSDDLRRTLRAACRQSSFFTVAAIASWNHKPNLITADVFQKSCEWAEDLILTPGRKRGWGKDPRNHIKSTRWTCGIPLWLSIQQPSERYDSEDEFRRATEFMRAHPFLRGPDTRILLASSSKQNAARFARKIRSYYESDRLWRWLFPELTPESHPTSAGKLLWGAEEFTLPGRTVQFGEPYLDTAGVESKATSRHYDLILGDDFVNEDNWQSDDEISKAIDWLLLGEYLLDRRDRMDPLGSAIFGLGNQWTMSDVVSFVEESMPEFDVWHRACWRCSVHGVERCTRTPDCLPTDEPLWSLKWSRQALQELKRAQDEKNPIIFSAQMEGRPFDSGVTYFRKDQLRSYAWHREDDGTYTAILFDATGHREVERIPQRVLRWFQCVDPASSDDPRSCRTAIGFFGEDPAGRLFLHDLWAHKAEPGAAVRAIVDQWWRQAAEGCKSYLLGVESVAAQKYVFTALNLEARHWTDPATGAAAPIWAYAHPPGRDNKILVPIVPDTRMRKYDRIRDLLGIRASSGTLYVRKGLPYMDLLLEEWTRCPVARSNDVIDMLAYAQKLCTGATGSLHALEVNKARMRRARRFREGARARWARGR